MGKPYSKLFVVTTLSAILVTGMTACSKSSEGGASSAPTDKTSASQSPSPSPSSTPKEVVTLYSIYPGDPPKGLNDVLPVINEKLAKDIGVKLELTWAPWDQYANKIALSIAAGEKIDFVWSGSSDLSSFTARKLIVPIDDVMAKYGKPIYDVINNKLFDTMKIDGKLMGIPSTGNAPLTDVYHSMLYREDLRVKYSLPKPDSIQNLDIFFKTIKEKEPGIVPLTSSSAAYMVQKWFGPEDFLGGTSGAAAYKVNDDKSVTVMPVQDAQAFKGSIAKVREWFQAGYIPQDMMNIADVSAKMKAGVTAAINGSALAAAEQQAGVAANVGGAILADQPMFGAKKYMSGNGGNGLYVTSVSKNADKVVQFWSWVYASQENYDLYNYGIKDKNYEIKNNRVSYKNSDFASFTGWMFKNMNYNRFPEGVTEEYINSIKHWDDGSEISPLMGFTFNPESVKTELAQLNTVNNAYSKTFNTGVVDPAQLLPEFASKMKAAGQDKVVKEAQRQIDEFLKNKK